MGSSVERWSGRMPGRQAVQQMQQADRAAGLETYMAERDLRAIAEVNQFGMMQVVAIKRWQRLLETLEPDAAEALAFVAQNGTLAIAQRLQQFNAEVGS